VFLEKTEKCNLWKAQVYIIWNSLKLNDIKCICMQAQMETKLDHIAAVFLPM
jgi:hypothetical protein